jgi:alpha-aminoadipic semialdehyde synthase
MYRRICRRDVTFGIRREQKGKWERRAPISPQDAKSLLKQSQCDAILVQPSSKRIFTDEEFSKVHSH